MQAAMHGGALDVFVGATMCVRRCCSAGAGRLTRSLKLLLALARGVPVVDAATWLDACRRARRAARDCAPARMQCACTAPPNSHVMCLLRAGLLAHACLPAHICCTTSS